MCGGFSSSNSPIETRRIPHPPIHTRKKKEKLIANKNEVLLRIKIDIRFTTYIYTYLHLYVAFENDLFDLMGGIWFIFFWRLCLLCSLMFPLQYCHGTNGVCVICTSVMYI